MVKTKRLFQQAYYNKYPLLKNTLTESVDSKKRFDRELTDGRKLTFGKDSGITSCSQLETLLLSMGGKVVRPAIVSGSPRFKNCGFLIEWQGRHYSALLRPLMTEKARKAFSPDNIGLGGKTYTTSDVVQFRQDITNGLRNECSDDTQLFLAIGSMLDNIEAKTPLSIHLLKIKKPVLNSIVCDFGEVLCAYSDLQLGIAKNKIEFPLKSNEPGVDYWRDGEVISVKGPQGGGKLNLVLYKLGLTSDSDVGKFLLAHAEHNREDYFKYAAKICPWVNAVAKLIGGTSIDNLKHFVQTPGSFDEFYKLLKGSTFPGVGLPKVKQVSDWQRRWEEEQSLNPLWFSIITLMTRWGQTDKNTITKVSEIMKPLFSTERFANISIEGLNIVSNEVPFKDVTTWETHYHSNAGGAWANWPSIRVKEIK
jgi:hypothetical protein